MRVNRRNLTILFFTLVIIMLGFGISLLFTIFALWA
jgi:hypothetical protein